MDEWNEIRIRTNDPEYQFRFTFWFPAISTIGSYAAEIGRRSLISILLSVI